MCCESNQQAPEPKETEFSKTLAQIMRERQASGRKYEPLENQLIGSVQQFQTPQFAAEQRGKALANADASFSQEKQRSDAELTSLGVNPNSGTYGNRSLQMSLGRGALRAGAFQNSGDATRRLAFDTLAATAGRGDAKIGQAIGAAGTGAQDYSNRQRTLIDYQGQQSDMSGIGNLFGTIGSAMIMSSKKAKKDIAPTKGALAQVRKMPAKNWTYKGDTARHTGPMAEDFKAATGKGNGRMLPLADLVGVQQAAIKELDQQVQALKKKRG